MKLSTGLVFIALAVTAANAYNVRSVEEEEELSVNHPTDADDKVSDDDSFFALFGSGSGLSPSSYNDDVEDTMNVKGGRKGQPDESSENIYPLDVEGVDDDTKLYLKPYTGTLASKYAEFTEYDVRQILSEIVMNSHVDPTSDEFDWLYRQIDWLHKQSVAQTEDSVNVKGGKQGVRLDDSSVGDLGAPNQTHYYLEIYPGPSSGHDFPVFTKKEFIRVYDLAKAGWLEFNAEIEDSNVKSGKHGVSVETADALDDQVEVKDGASSHATKLVKSSSVSAPHIDNLYDDDTKGVLSDADEDDLTNVKKSDHEYQAEESEVVNEKMATKISEPFY